MLVLLRLAQQLGQTVEWTMNNVSMLELRTWSKYWKLQEDAQRRKKK